MSVAEIVEKIEFSRPLRDKFLPRLAAADKAAKEQVLTLLKKRARPPVITKDLLVSTYSNLDRLDGRHRVKELDNLAKNLISGTAKRMTERQDKRNQITQKI